ncbi:MAG: queuosine precursor transporter [Holosporaceae bacterium]|jgi:uncharacterized integral membrane protein (TIGR00697 family)|nr:queuosine precursor transporter [Holosporaceae bacterium]
MAEFLSLSTLFSCFIVILVMAKFFGKGGLLVYSAISVVISNLQVLRLTKYSMMDNPVALGTVVFSTLFAVDNILTEYYGAKAARQCVWMNFICFLFFTFIMEVTNLHPAIENWDCVNLHRELKIVFSPCFTLFISSLISSVIGQLVDIFVYSNLQKIMKGRYTSLRSFAAMALSTFVDNFIFSILAWIIFAKNPVNIAVLWKTYIVATVMIRLVIAVLCVPLVKLCGSVILKREKFDV